LNPLTRVIAELATTAELCQGRAMAWRIDEFLVRGEIDNRTRGRVEGRLWFLGRADPVELTLVGNCWRDLAGHRLQFVNPTPREGLPDEFSTRQTGEVGDITASRKVKVPEISMDELTERFRRREPFPWHWGNSLYLEWYSDSNGRVVIESAHYQLTFDPEASWEMSEAEETDQRERNGGAMSRFMSRLVEAGDETNIAPPPAETPVDLPAASGDISPALDVPGDIRPLTEEEAERLQAESDKLNDRVQARLEREGPDADLEQILAEEIERARRERGEPEPTPEEEEENRRWIEEINAAAAELDEHSEPGGEEPHPLMRRARELSTRVATEIEAHSWEPDDAVREHPVVELQTSLMKAGGKLAGAIGWGEWPPPRMLCGTKIVWLKRAATYLEDALLAADACRAEALVDLDWLVGVKAETEAIAAETAILITELRERLTRGFD
jgi:hypothetical protein